MKNKTPNNRKQVILFPELLEERIGNKPHTARFFLYLAETLDMSFYKNKYMGTKPYDRIVLTALIFYSMNKGYFSSKGIIEFTKDSLGAQWILNGMTIPSRKTVERVLTSILDNIENIFMQTLLICDSLKLIGKETTYIDGVKVKANASKHKAMSYKHLKKKLNAKKGKISEIFDEIINEIDIFEDMSDDDLKKIIAEEGMKVHAVLQKMHTEYLQNKQEQIFTNAEEVTEEKIDYQRINSVSDILSQTDESNYNKLFESLNDIGFINKRIERMESAKKELESKWEKENGKKTIPEKQQINFTDSDSAIMVTKHFGVQQCFNNLAIVDSKVQIILGASTTNCSSDQLGLIPTVEHAESVYGSLSGIKLGGDAGFFSANNIQEMLRRGIDYYVSFPEAVSIYAKNKFIYNEEENQYTCPRGCILTSMTTTGNREKQTYYNEEACKKCENHKQCTKAADGIRRIERHMTNDKLRKQAKEKAKSPEGKEILRLRKTIPEPVWGNMKLLCGLE